MARLTQQQYDLTCALMKLGFEIHSGNEHLIFADVDAYAAAQLEAKDKAIEGLVAQNLETFKKLQQQEAENHLKDAEIKRLRDKTREVLEKAASYEFFEKHAHRFIVEDSSFGWRLRPAMDYDNYAAAIKAIGTPSPAPVTEEPKQNFSLQMYECNRCEWYGQVGESIETESYDVCPKCLSEDLTLLDSPKNEDQE